jgi:subtilase family serine protease
MNQSEDHLFASGGGTSRIFPRPSYQDGVQAEVGTARGIPDIALSAGGEDDAVLVYSSYAGERSEYYIDGGTSAATPEFAGIVAIADQVAGHDLGQLNPLLYALAAHNGPGLVDVTLGTNTAAWRTHGKQHKVIGWAAGPGYDLASGLGTVDAADLVQELAG